MAKSNLNVSFKRSGAALERLPSTEPADIENLMFAIDRKVQHLLPSIFESVAVGINQQMLIQTATVTQLSQSTDIPKKRINDFLLREKLLDLPDVERLCLTLSGKLRLALVSRNNFVLNCDDHLRDASSLAAHVNANLADLVTNPLPEVFFQTCGLEVVPGLSGGYLEKTCPVAFRLLRHALFMRAQVVVRTAF